jgi:hypothetical protein
MFPRFFLAPSPLVGEGAERKPGNVRGQGGDGVHAHVIQSHPRLDPPLEGEEVFITARMPCPSRGGRINRAMFALRKYIPSPSRGLQGEG